MQLEKGINLAAEFIDNPFSESFRNLDASVGRKQQFETDMIKRMVTNFRLIRSAVGDDPELDGLLNGLYNKLAGKQQELQEKARATVQPLSHKLTVQAK